VWLSADPMQIVASKPKPAICGYHLRVLERAGGVAVRIVLLVAFVFPAERGLLP
jgi:hypothetical protein